MKINELFVLSVYCSEGGSYKTGETVSMIV